MSGNQRVLLIGLDAADPILIQQWIEDGTLPNLAALKKTGTYVRLTTSSKYLAGSPWPTFYTCQPPCNHGIYQDFQWCHERMGYYSPKPDWLPISPFWRHLDNNVFVIAYDVPMILGCEAFTGIEISGWASHDNIFQPDSHPREILSEIEYRFGQWPIGSEPYGPSSIDYLLGLREQLIENTKKSTRLALWLLNRKWDLAIVVFSALHRGGHRFWDRSSVKGAIPTSQGAVFDGTLRDLYIACDEAVGELVASVSGCYVIIFSLHGMMEDTSRADLLDEMLERVLLKSNNARRHVGLLRRMVDKLPSEQRRYLSSKVPTPLRDFLMTMWATGGVDWKKTPAFTLRADLQGYIRINLQGREKKGIVPPGNCYNEICSQIAEGLSSFYDASTGEPIVKRTVRIDNLYPEGIRRDRLPDLIVLWQDTPASANDAIESPQFGIIRRSVPGRSPNGRSGNHRPEGFLIACGKDILTNVHLQNTADILDLTPTVMRLLGIKTSLSQGGEIISGLISGS
jgi:predicted AlkP superfamily phosphohydrolase/phosphomutase